MIEIDKFPYCGWNNCPLCNGNLDYIENIVRSGQDDELKIKCTCEKYRASFVVHDQTLIPYLEQFEIGIFQVKRTFDLTVINKIFPPGNVHLLDNQIVRSGYYIKEILRLSTVLDFHRFNTEEKIKKLLLFS